MSNDEDNPNILYHYTSIDAFRSIMESKIMRATRYDQMNDFSEVKLGIDKLLKTINNYKMTHSSIDPEYYSYLKDISKKLETHDPEIYILSFSSVKDSLEQWRAYAQNGGVAIGFDRKMVKQGFLTEPKEVTTQNQLLKCIYTDENGHLDLNSEVEKRVFKPKCITMYKKQNIKLIELLFEEIFRMICRIKHGAYRFENEWRCVNFEPNQKDYQIRLNAKNRWYIELEFDPNKYIKELWISPHGNKEDYMSIVDYYKRIKYKLNYKIYKSQIPFRGS